MYFHYDTMADNDAPGAWPVWTPWTRLVGFIKRTTTLLQTSYLVVSEKIFNVFLM